MSVAWICQYRECGTERATARTRPRTGVPGRKRAAGRALRGRIDELAAGDGVHEVDVHFQVSLDGRVGFGVDGERGADTEDAAEVQAGQPDRPHGDVPREKLALEHIMMSFCFYVQGSRWRGRTMMSAFRLRVPSREASNPTTRLKAEESRAERMPAKVTA